MHRNVLVTLLSLLLVGCGSSVPLATAHTAITTGCATAATHAGGSDDISDLELDGFESDCRGALHYIELWQSYEVDGGTPDAGR